MADDLLKRRELRLPAEYRLGFTSVSHQPRRVASPTWCIADSDRAAGYGACGVDDFLHREAQAVAEVERRAGTACHQVIHRQRMS
ncbi:hypothetical protein D3C77_699090 [compost metagenome]